MSLYSTKRHLEMASTEHAQFLREHLIERIKPEE
jgi:hypothetical protein